MQLFRNLLSLILKGLKAHAFGLIKIIKIDVMKKDVQNNAPASAVYGVGIIGAAVYYISAATGFWVGVLGVLKALVWPAFLVYEALKALGA